MLEKGTIVKYYRMGAVRYDVVVKSSVGNGLVEVFGSKYQAGNFDHLWMSPGRLTAIEFNDVPDNEQEAVDERYTMALCPDGHDYNEVSQSHDCESTWVECSRCGHGFGGSWS